MKKIIYISLCFILFGCKSNQYGYQANNPNISPKDSILSSEKCTKKNNIIVFYPEDKYFINIRSNIYIN